MANPYRTTVTIDGQKFQAVTTSVKFNTEKDRSGVAQMGSLSTKIRVWADLHDNVNLPFSTVKHMFDLANVVTRDKIKPMKIEFWKDDSQQDALISYSFNGWIRRFETSNPLDFLPRAQAVSTEDQLAEGASPSLNHMLVLDLEPALNQQNFGDVQSNQPGSNGRLIERHGQRDHGFAAHQRFQHRVRSSMCNY